MSAGPSVGGSNWGRYVGFAPATLAAVATATAALLGVVLWTSQFLLRLPLEALAAVSAIALVADTSGWGRFVPSSPWRIPRSWCRGGSLRAATVFGFFLGLGLATAAPSPGIYVLLTFALTGRPLLMIVPAFVVFGVFRSVPAFISRRRAAHSGSLVRVTEALASQAMKMRYLEVPLLAIVIVAALR